MLRDSPDCVDDSTVNITMPYGYFGPIPNLMAGYQRYANKAKGKFAINGHRHPAEILMFQGALKPHPELQAMIDKLMRENGLTADDEQRSSYMTLHARIEPDMQKHPVCRQYKVLNLTDILDLVYAKWPEPPVSKVFMPINRQYLEKEGILDPDKPKNKINWIAVENLKTLNQIRNEGMWNGQVPVLEFGSNALQGSRYELRPSTAGAILNYFVAINARIFVGTEVSSYSHDLLATRFYRNKMENYKYRPEGLIDWTPPGTIDPQGHRC